MKKLAVVLVVLVAFGSFAGFALAKDLGAKEKRFCFLWLVRLEEDLADMWKDLHPRDYGQSDADLQATLGNGGELSDGILYFEKSWRASHWRLVPHYARIFETYLHALTPYLDDLAKTFPNDRERVHFSKVKEILTQLTGKIQGDWFKPQEEMRKKAITLVRGKLVPDLRNYARAARTALRSAVADAAALEKQEAPAAAEDDPARGFDALAGEKTD